MQYKMTKICSWLMVFDGVLFISIFDMLVRVIYICICVLNFHASLLITCAWHESPPDLLKLEKSKRKGSMNSQIWGCLKEKVDGWRCEGCCAWLGWSRFEGLELIHQTTKCQQGKHKNSALGGTLGREEKERKEEQNFDDFTF